MTSRSSLPVNKLRERFNFPFPKKEYKEAVEKFLKAANESDLSSFYYMKRKILPVELRHIFQQYAVDKFLDELPSSEEMQNFAYEMEGSAFVDDNVLKISQEDLLNFMSRMPPRMKDSVPVRTIFMECTNYLDSENRLSTEVISQFLYLRVALLRYGRILSNYDEDCTGYVNRQQLENFLKKEVIVAIDTFFDVDEALLKNYLKTVLSMFFFFLDPRHFGRCRITDVVLSGFIENMLVLQRNNPEENPDENTENWFSPEKTLELTSLFKMLDANNVGYLTEADFKKINDGAYTNAFVRRLFEVQVKDNGRRMSYDEFLLFQIASEHLAHPSAMKYYFKILDLNEDGYLTAFEFRHFYNSLRSAYCNFVADSEAMPDFHDFTDSLFDFAQPKTTERVSVNDLIECKQGFEFIVYLINYVEFSRFENKEDGGIEAEEGSAGNWEGIEENPTKVECTENDAPLESITEETENSRSSDAVTPPPNNENEEFSFAQVDDSFSHMDNHLAL